ncbi:MULTISPECIES: phosphotransferase family protein [Methylorubrum]|uniref:phosphotransferase family protein n=1 Tax=Methylorubrum TaxID=2282523 RepID=UPI0016475928|nr:aminoglycoside phosphotransferase family protein [Methylorubrum populi]
MVTHDRKSLVLNFAESRLGGALDSFESPLTVLASPAWRGVEADIWVAKRGDRAEVFKHYHSDVDHYIEPAAAIANAKAAGDIGVGPRVLDSWDGHGLMAMEYLGEGWRAGGLHDAASEGIRRAIIAAKKSLHAGPRLVRDGDIFRDIKIAHAVCLRRDAYLPSNIAAFLDFSARAEKAMSQLVVHRVACHRDGNTANVMVGPNGAVRLLDYDLSANADPYEDLGCYLLEMYDREPEAKEGFREWTGFFSEGLFNRSMVYGILDDLRWGLNASAVSATSPRSTLDFIKYASWRLLRFEMLSQTSAAADRLRQLS